MDAQKQPRYDLSLMGNADKHNLAVTFLDSLQRFYDDPINRDRFEKWRRATESRSSVAKN